MRKIVLSFAVFVSFSGIAYAGVQYHATCLSHPMQPTGARVGPARSDSSMARQDCAAHVANNPGHSCVVE